MMEMAHRRCIPLGAVPVFLLSVLFCFRAVRAAEETPKATVAYSSRSIAPIDFFVAEALGRLRKDI
jgi:hypothetical protein